MVYKKKDMVYMTVIVMFDSGSSSGSLSIPSDHGSATLSSQNSTTGLYPTLPSFTNSPAYSMFPQAGGTTECVYIGRSRGIMGFG